MFIGNLARVGTGLGPVRAELCSAVYLAELKPILYLFARNRLNTAISRGPTPGAVRFQKPADHLGS